MFIIHFVRGETMKHFCSKVIIKKIKIYPHIVVISNYDNEVLQSQEKC